MLDKWIENTTSVSELALKRSNELDDQTDEVREKLQDLKDLRDEGKWRWLQAMSYLILFL